MTLKMDVIRFISKYWIYILILYILVCFFAFSNQKIMGNSETIEGVELSGRAANPKVKNGVAYETCTYQLSSNVKRIIIPYSFTFELLNDPENTGDIKFYVKKQLGFMGHPPKKMSISIGGKKNAGICFKEDIDPNEEEESEGTKTVTFGTFGEFGNRDGSFTINVHMLIKTSLEPNLEIVKMTNLDGQNSVAADMDSYMPSVGYWYGSTKPDSEFQVLEYKNDPNKSNQYDMPKSGMDKVKEVVFQTLEGQKKLKIDKSKLIDKNKISNEKWDKSDETNGIVLYNAEMGEEEVVLIKKFTSHKSSISKQEDIDDIMEKNKLFGYEVIGFMITNKEVEIVAKKENL